jgi:hypothetical protein
MNGQESERTEATLSQDRFHGVSNFQLTFFWCLDYHTTVHYPVKWKTKVSSLKFKVYKSVHHCTIHINHLPEATIFQFIILAFICSSTCFGRFPAHHQELNDCSGSLWFLPSYRGDSRAVFAVGPASPTTNTGPFWIKLLRPKHAAHI